MAIALKNDRAVFLHIPKTGGNWVRKTLEQLRIYQRSLRVCHKHASLDRVTAALNKRRNKPLPFLFCFVRHPASWYESWFKYMTQPARNWKHWGKDRYGKSWHPCAPLDGLGATEFNQFVDNCLSQAPGFVSRLYRHYDNGRDLSFIGRIENLQADLLSVLQELQFDVSAADLQRVSPVNVSPQPKSPVEWDPDLYAKMLNQETDALHRYGYLTESQESAAA